MDPRGDKSTGVKINNSDINYIPSGDEQTWRPWAKHDPTHFWWEISVKYLSSRWFSSWQRAELFIFIIYIIKLLTLLDVSKEFLKTKIESQSSRNESTNIEIIKMKWRAICTPLTSDTVSEDKCYPVDEIVVEIWARNIRGQASACYCKSPLLVSLVRGLCNTPGELKF